MPGGIFSKGEFDSWSQKRSLLNHTEFGNRILSKWTDSSRWDSLIKFICQRGYHWSSDNKREWQSSFENWKTVKIRMLKHSRRIYSDFQAFRFSPDKKYSNSPQINFCETVARQYFTNKWKFDVWVLDVERAIKKIDKTINRLNQIKDKMFNNQIAFEIAESHLQKQLTILSERGRRLKVIFNGHRYFNYGNPD